MSLAGERLDAPAGDVLVAVARPADAPAVTRTVDGLGPLDGVAVEAC